MYLWLTFLIAGLLSGTLISAFWWCLAALPALLGMALWPVARTRIAGVLLAFLLGAFWSGWWLDQALQHRLPDTLDRTRVELTLLIEQVEMRPGSIRLLARVQGAAQLPADYNLPPLRTVQLNWYRPEQVVQAGELWQAEVVLRSPRNFLNPLPFDYEAFLLSRDIDAGGYIRTAQRLLAAAPQPALRERLLNYLQQQHKAEAWPWIAGLVFGEQNSFSAEQWRLAQATGTLHLLVVSGLHVGLVTLLGLGLWALLGRLPLLVGGQGGHWFVAGRLLLVLLVTGLYVWLAGAGIALQRAWVMLLVLLLLQQSRWRLRWSLAILLALVAVLVINPLIWTRPGLSFSFVAVLALLAFFSGRQSNRAEALWLPQWVVFWGLLPVLLWWGQPVSLLQCLANLVAIPLLSVVILPLTLAAAILPAGLLDEWIVWVGEGFWQLLAHAESIPLPYLPFMPLITLAFWLMWLVLARAGVSLVVLWPALLLLLLWFIREPEVQPVVVLADVGQGQSIMFISPDAVLVYDAGPRFSEQFDSGDAIVRPLLQRHGVRRLQRLIISHADLDHAGGTAALLRAFPVDELWGGEIFPAVEHAEPPMQICHAQPAHWQSLSPQVLYRFLSVPESSVQRVRKSRNNASCVVQVQWYGQRFMLTGDIGTDVEAILVEHYGDELRSDVLLLGHHGSQTSSSLAFLVAVAPAEAWISAGFNNRFGHPAAVVTGRLQQLGIPWSNTATDGALVRKTEGVTLRQRERWQPAWRQP